MEDGKKSSKRDGETRKTSTLQKEQGIYKWRASNELVIRISFIFLAG